MGPILNKEYSQADFYLFRSRNYLTTFYSSPDIVQEALKNKDFDKCYEIGRKLEFGDYEGLQFPLVYREQPESGKRFRDVLDNRNVARYLISDRMKQLLIENNITGWKSFPIVMYDKHGKEVPGYNGFSITGHCGGIVTYHEDICQFDEEFMWYKGVSIDIDQWDGSDIFNVHAHHKMITKRVYKLFKEHKIDAIEMTSLPKYRHGFSCIHKASSNI